MSLIFGVWSGFVEGMLRRLLKARGLETVQFSAQVLCALYLNRKVSVRKDDDSHRKTTKFATPHR